MDHCCTWPCLGFSQGCLPRTPSIKLKCMSSEYLKLEISTVHLFPGEVRLKVMVHIVLDDLVDGLPDGAVRPLEVLQLLLEQDVVLLGLGLLLVAHGGGGGRGRGGGGGGGGGLLAGGRGPVGHGVVTVLSIYLNNSGKWIVPIDAIVTLVT